MKQTQRWIFPQWGVHLKVSKCKFDRNPNVTKYTMCTYMHSVTPGTPSAQIVKEQFEKCLKQNSHQWGFF